MTERVARTSAIRDRRAAFTALAETELTGAYRLAAVILGDPWQAEDATHDAVLQAWLRFGSLRDGARFGGWFQRILVNVCRDRLRERTRRPTIGLVDPHAPAGDPTADVDDRLVLDAAFEQLTPDHRIALSLRYYADLTVNEIADLIGVPSGTVKSRIHFATLKMREALESAEGGRS
jgi:RNA polymerase sigma-70 factor, ECF subfamily